jgi:hypothetical protein
MLKNKINLEINKEDRVYNFECDPTAPLGEIYDVLTQMKSFILEKISEAEKISNENEKKE